MINRSPRTRRLSVLALASAALFGSSSPARGQLLPPALSDPWGTPEASSAQKQQHLALSRLGDLRFGAFVPDAAAGGALTITPAGAKVPTGGIVALNNVPAGPATYVLTAQNCRLVHITLPDSIDLRNADLAGSFMRADAFRTSLSSLDILTTGSPNTFTLGATLHVGANQPPGAYQGCFDVTLDAE